MSWQGSFKRLFLGNSFAETKMISSLFKPGQAATAFVAVLLLGSPRSRAQETTRSPDSDGGGTRFSLTCGETKVLIGVVGGAGQWVNRVRGVCMEINNAGGWIGPESLTDPTATSGGTGFFLKCPRNSAVNALSGRAGQWLDMLQVHCKPLGASGHLTGSMVLARDDTKTSVGGSAGNTGFGPNECASDRPARILKADAGSVLGTPTVDRIWLDCQQPTLFALDRVRPLYATTLGLTSSATAEFNRNAPEAQTVALSQSGQGVITIPSTAALAKGARGAPFTVRTVQTGCAMITASYAGRSRISHLVVQPDRALNDPMWLSTPDELLIAPQQQSATLTASIAPNAVVTLTSSNPDVASVPASVTNRSGERMNFPIIGLKRGCTQIIATYRTFTVRRIVKVEEIGG
jgi:hypothetical protein